MRNRGTLALLAATVLIAGGFGARAQLRTPVVHAAQTWTVQVGADVDLNSGVTANAYFPSSITVDAGDTVSWAFPSELVHTVTFDNGVVPPLAAKVEVDPSSGAADISAQVNPAGLTGAPPTFDPKLQISSGVPLDPPNVRRQARTNTSA